MLDRVTFVAEVEPQRLVLSSFHADSSVESCQFNSAARQNHDCVRGKTNLCLR